MQTRQAVLLRAYLFLTMLAMVWGMTACAPVSSASPAPSGSFLPTVALMPTSPPSRSLPLPWGPSSMGNAALQYPKEEQGVDEDGNGLFDYLRVDVPIFVSYPGWIGLQGMLSDRNGVPIATGSLVPDMQRNAPILADTFDFGMRIVPIYFKGRAIAETVRDGPYTIEIRLQGREPATVRLPTRAYQRSDFQGHLAQIVSVSDSAATIEGQHILRVGVDLNIMGTGSIDVSGQLFAGDRQIVTVNRQMELKRGRQEVDLDFPAQPILDSQRDGPYTIFIAVSDKNYASDQVYSTTVKLRTELTR